MPETKETAKVAKTAVKGTVPSTTAGAVAGAKTVESAKPRYRLKREFRALPKNDLEQAKATAEALKKLNEMPRWQERLTKEESKPAMPTKQLYDRLTKDGYELGSHEKFNTALQDDKNARTIYDNLTKEGYELGTYDDFRNGTKNQQEPEPMTDEPAQAQAWARYQEAARQAESKQTPAEKGR